MTTRIVVLADTHLPRGHQLPRRLQREIEAADMVIHLGDFTGVELADVLERTGKLVAVHGNNDMLAVRRRYPARRDVAVGGRTIRCIHGDIGGRTAAEAAAAEHGADIVLYGHSHMPGLNQHHGTLLFNPGSPTQRRFAPFRSYGILSIGEVVDAQVVSIEG
jgi:putative phosphoesterase